MPAIQPGTPRRQPWLPPGALAASRLAWRHGCPHREAAGAGRAASGSLCKCMVRGTFYSQRRDAARGAQRRRFRKRNRRPPERIHLNGQAEQAGKRGGWSVPAVGAKRRSLGNWTGGEQAGDGRTYNEGKQRGLGDAVVGQLGGGGDVGSMSGGGAGFCRGPERQ